MNFKKLGGEATRGKLGGMGSGFSEDYVEWIPMLSVCIHIRSTSMSVGKLALLDVTYQSCIRQLISP